MELFIAVYLYLIYIKVNFSSRETAFLQKLDEWKENLAAHVVYVLSGGQNKHSHFPLEWQRPLRVPQGVYGESKS